MLQNKGKNNKVSINQSPNPTISEEDDIIYLASAGYDHTIRFWSPHEGKCNRVIQHPHSQVNDLKITPSKVYLVAASFQHVRMYNILTINSNNPDINLEGFNNNVLSIGFTEDSNWLFSGGEDCVTRIWDLGNRTNQSQRMFESGSTVNSVKLHPNQVELFIGTQYGFINIWDIRFNSHLTPSIRLQQQHPSINTGVQCLSLNPMEDILAAIDNNGHVHIYSPARQLKLFKTWKAHSKYGIKCLFSPNGKYLVTTSADHTAKVWRTCDIMKQQSSSRTKIDDDDNNSEASDNTLDDLDTTSTKQDQSTSSPTNSQPPSPTLQLQQLSLNSTTTTTTNTNNLTPQPYKVLTTEHQRWVWDVSFSADSQFLVTASSDSVVRLWHVETADIRREYTGHQKAVTALAFSD